eukprot:10073699-Karenia_brevis.AAC.1
MVMMMMMMMMMMNGQTVTARMCFLCDYERIGNPCASAGQQPYHAQLSCMPHAGLALERCPVQLATF